MAAAPRVSIGLPVFNGELTVARAIESALAQTFEDFELIVSDNASSDGTAPMVRRYAERDARVRHLRQPTTVSALENFRRVLEAARAPYFMWLSADDYVLPRLLERTVAVLDAYPDVVCCAPRVDFLAPDGSRRAAGGTFALLGTFSENLRQFLHDPMDNSRFYGVFRRPVLARALPAIGYHACDWTASVATLQTGKHWELAETLLVRAANDVDKYTRMVDAAFPSAAGRLLPLLPFTRALLFDLRVPRTAITLYQLVRLNAIYHVMYALYRYPRYGRVAHRVSAAIERAAAAAWRVVRGERARTT